MSRFMRSRLLTTPMSVSELEILKIKIRIPHLCIHERNLASVVDYVRQHTQYIFIDYRERNLHRARLRNLLLRNSSCGKRLSRGKGFALHPERQSSQRQCGIVGGLHCQAAQRRRKDILVAVNTRLQRDRLTAAGIVRRVRLLT